jgi:hypothetical protein
MISRDTEASGNRRKRILLISSVLLLGTILIGLGGFVIWASNPAPPMAEALTALESDNEVTVEIEPWLTFTPTQEMPREGFILYPGGLVDARAYAPPARAIAAAGYQVVIVPMPLNLSLLAPNRAGEVMDAFPNVETWSIGGHSLGGDSAAGFVERHPERIENLLLWGAYLSGNKTLRDQEIGVTSIFGTLDGVATPDEIAGSRLSLPTDTEYVAIEGGNHAQFGWYGEQDGDNPATISREEQQAQTIQATLQRLQSLSP